MTSLTSDRQDAGESVDFAMPDFLDLAGEASDARFSCSSSSVDGGVFVYTDHLVMIDRGRSERVAFEVVIGWQVAVDGAVWLLTVQTTLGSRTARIHPAFIASAMSAVEAAVGPSKNA